MTDISKSNYEVIKKWYNKFDYEFLEEENVINICAVRSLNNITNKFNDYLFISYLNDFKGKSAFFTTCTTDPGLYWLNNPMNKLGTAVVKEGFYKDLWQIGLHQGKYEALTQKNNITVYRDNNRDSKLDYISGSEDTGIFGINLHHASESAIISEDVNKWSAGCIVINSIIDWKKIIMLAKKQKELTDKKYFNFALFLEKQLY